LRIAAVLALCVAGAVVAALLLWPRGEAAPALPAVAAVRFSAMPLERALADEAERLRATEAVATGQLDALLAQDPLDLRIPQITEQGITARDVVVRRHGSEAAVEATVDPAQLAALAPGSVEDLAFDADASRPGELVVHGTASALGFDVPVTVKVVVRDGALVAVPEGLPIDDIVVFADPRVRIRGIRAGSGQRRRPRAGRRGPTELKTGGLHTRAPATQTGRC
jgi:hypothetical protein